MRQRTKALPRWTCLVSLVAVIGFTGSVCLKRVWATPAAGFTTTTIMKGRLDAIDLSNKPLIAESVEMDRRAKEWLSLEETAGPPDPDLYVQSNVWQPGGSTGWHTHPGRSLIIVAAGTLTEYEAPDPNCKPHTYTAGMSFVDHDHAHILRNEGDGVARTLAIQLIRAGEARRIDAADPGNCHF